jgi:hypothetical protein
MRCHAGTLQLATHEPAEDTSHQERERGAERDGSRDDRPAVDRGRVPGCGPKETTAKDAFLTLAGAVC